MERNSPVTVGLVQINNSFSGQSYFPYSVGVLQAYAQAHLADPGNYAFLPPIYKRIGVTDAVEQLMTADIVGFSVYVWNFQISCAIARELKRRKPNVLIVFGGPHVPDAPETNLVTLGTPESRIETFLGANPFIDITVHGEGEKPFLGIIQDDPWSIIPSVTYRENGRVFSTPRVTRMKDLDEVPSPYLTGVFDPLIAANPSEEWLVIWETNRGCPFECTFCDWGSFLGAKIGKWGIERLFAEMDWFAAHRIFYVFCADANFGILDRDLEIARYCVEVKARTGYPSKFSVQNRKNTTRKSMDQSWAVQKVLSDGGLNQGVVVSMQSLNPATLQAIKRDNMRPQFFTEIQNRFTEGGVATMSDLILGMPEETYDSFADGVSKLIEGGQHNRIQFNNCSRLPNAEMGNPIYQKRYGMETVQSRIVNIHGVKSEDDEVPEFQELFIATSAMPREDWVRARTFAWMAALLHFDKILQIPLIVAHEMTGASYRELIELFSELKFANAGNGFFIVTELREFFRLKAEDIQNGGEEYCHSFEWLDMWWGADEYALIRMVTSGTLAAFYEEAEQILLAFIRERGVDIPLAALSDAISLNRSLVKTPFQSDDLTVNLHWNVWEFYQAIIQGKPASLQYGSFPSVIHRTSAQWTTWEAWFREVVWWGNKRGAYLYGAEPTLQIAGHF